MLWLTALHKVFITNHTCLTVTRKTRNFSFELLNIVDISEVYGFYCSKNAVKCLRNRKAMKYFVLTSIWTAGKHKITANHAVRTNSVVEKSNELRGILNRNGLNGVFNYFSRAQITTLWVKYGSVNVLSGISTNQIETTLYMFLIW